MDVTVVDKKTGRLYTNLTKKNFTIYEDGVKQDLTNFATGEGPGETAFATTAVFATGAPMTPTLPTRAGLIVHLLRFRLLRRLRSRR